MKKNETKTHKQTQFIFSSGKWQFRFSSKAKDGICQVRFCRKERHTAVEKRNRKIRTYLRQTCNCCRDRLFRLRHPHRSIFKDIRCKARTRGIAFTLTYRQFCRLVDGTGYVEKRGCHRDNLHIDRIKPELGYSPGNVRIIPAQDNIAKGNRERRKYNPEPVEEELPDDNEPF